MSRIGKQPITIPKGVEVNYNKPNIEVSGKHGKLSLQLPPEVELQINEEQMSVETVRKTRKTKGYLGLYRTLLDNMVVGVTDKFSKVLEIRGVGYRAQVQGKNLVLNMGYSHPVTITPPNEITFSIEENTKIVVSGIDKNIVGQIAAKIRQVRPPEPYKGKGIRYKGEHVNIKVGKSGK
uniref:Large ribosomal subunit protein uL6c n=1 Tax=Olisthodiscus luteus TaxID=83000 RepID=A0A7U0KSR9_OLILU|nr:ribosomal protein L6 [Olisthodiscus luteus]QQW50582.1 ribosomal protein L6 [Olisthodiscus luteus]